MLITQRAAIKDWALAWEFPAGSALAGETSRDGAVRELLEETGLRTSVDGLTFVGRFTEESALLDLYVACGLDVSSLTLDPDEVADSEWVPLNAVRERYRAGLFAGPWVTRLDALWPALVAAVRGCEGAVALRRLIDDGVALPPPHADPPRPRPRSTTGPISDLVADQRR